MTDKDIIAALVNALERLIEATYTDAIEGQDMRIARIHARAAIALAREP